MSRMHLTRTRRRAAAVALTAVLGMGLSGCGSASAGSAAVVDGRRVLQDAPAVPFEAGRVVKVWFSPDAPLTSYNGEGVNAIPVDGLPVRPGWGRLLTSLALTIAAGVAGLVATVWVARRWARRY